MHPNFILSRNYQKFSRIVTFYNVNCETVNMSFMDFHTVGLFSTLPIVQDTTAKSSLSLWKNEFCREYRSKCHPGIELKLSLLNAYIVVSIVYIIL